jgi:hypothetical protein
MEENTFIEDTGVSSSESHSPSPKRLKQYVIVKEYYGHDEDDDNRKKERKKRYIEKTILKERVLKPEKDSLRNIEFVKIGDNFTTEKEKKYVEVNDGGTEDKNSGFILAAALTVGGLLGAYALVKSCKE